MEDPYIGTFPLCSFYRQQLVSIFTGRAGRGGVYLNPKRVGWLLGVVRVVFFTSQIRAKKFCHRGAIFQQILLINCNFQAIQISQSSLFANLGVKIRENGQFSIVSHLFHCRYAEGLATTRKNPPGRNPSSISGLWRVHYIISFEKLAPQFGKNVLVTEKYQYL